MMQPRIRRRRDQTWGPSPPIPIQARNELAPACSPTANSSIAYLQLRSPSSSPSRRRFLVVDHLLAKLYVHSSLLWKHTFIDALAFAASALSSLSCLTPQHWAIRLPHLFSHLLEPLTTEASRALKSLIVTLYIYHGELSLESYLLKSNFNDLH
jgi:hypothetical protein